MAAIGLTGTGVKGKGILRTWKVAVVSMGLLGQDLE